MTHSLSEVEATARKAARGVGLPWGFADEAGQAIGWLCGAGLDGVRALADHVEASDGTDVLHCAPRSLDGVWRAARGPVLCPLQTGCALSDDVAAWAEPGLRLKRVSAPLLLLPFAARAARRMGRTAIVMADSAVARVFANHAVLVPNADGSFPAMAAELVVALGEPDGAAPAPAPFSRFTPDPGAWARLNLFAQRVYAPETDASRLTGAGAGLSDND